MKNLRYLLVSISIFLSLFFFTSYFVDSLNFINILKSLFSCFFTDSFINTSLSHAYYCESTNTWNLLKIFGILGIFFTLYKICSDKLLIKFQNFSFSPIGFLILISIFTGIIAIFVNSIFDLAFLNEILITKTEILQYKIENHPELSYLSNLIIFIIISIRSFIKIGFLMILGLGFYNLGKLLIQKYFDENNFSNILYFCLGISIYGFILTILAMFGMLNTLTNWLLILGLIFFILKDKKSRKHNLTFIKSTFLDITKTNFFTISLYLFLISWISINLLEITRPMPIGWDDMTMYLNYGKNLFETGHLPYGKAMRFFEIFVSQGYILFGTGTNAELALLMSFSGSFFILICLFSLFQELFKDKYNLNFLLILCFYTMPMVFFQAAKDLKMDSGLTLICLGIISLIIYTIQSQNKNYSIISIILGFLFGIAFTIKFTSIFLIFGTFLFITWKYLGKLGILFGTLLVGLFTWQNYHLISAFYDLGPIINKLPEFSFYLILLLTVTIFIYLIKNSSKELKYIILIPLGFIIALSPWILKNHFETNSFKVSDLIHGREISPQINLSSLDIKYPEISKENEISFIPNNLVTIGSSFNEEVTRYAGYYDDLLNKYILKPWQIHINKNSQGLYVDIGFIWLFSLGLFLPLIIFHRKSILIKILSYITLTYWILWIILAQGIIWYGMPGFILILILIGHYYIEEENLNSKINNLFKTFITIWIILVTLLRFDSFKMHHNIAYGGGYINSKKVLELTLPSYKKIFDEINQNSPTNIHPNYIYRIGTFIPYFIENDFERIFNDSQLDTFTPLFSEEDQYITTLRLALLGFRYIIIDTNTATIDRTPEKSLTKKVKRLEKYASNNPYLKVILNDPNSGIVALEIKEELRNLYKN